MTDSELRKLAEEIITHHGDCQLGSFYCAQCPFKSDERCSQKQALDKARQWLDSHLEQAHTSNAHKLASDHWNYINELLESHGVPAESRAMCQFHYVSAFIHGYKHAEEEK